MQSCKSYTIKGNSQRLNGKSHRSQYDEVISIYVFNYNIQIRRVDLRESFFKRRREYMMTAAVFWHVIVREVAYLYRGTVKDLAENTKTTAYVLKRIMASENHGVRISFRTGHEIIRLHARLYPYCYPRKTNYIALNNLDKRWPAYTADIINFSRRSVEYILERLEIDRDRLGQIINGEYLEDLKFEQAMNILELYLEAIDELDREDKTI